MFGVSVYGLAHLWSVCNQPVSVTSLAPWLPESLAPRSLFDYRYIKTLFRNTSHIFLLFHSRCGILKTFQPLWHFENISAVVAF